jgi:hypothetical protein
MDTELGHCLTGTLNPDPNVRIKAELRLAELLPHPGSLFQNHPSESLTRLPDAGSALAAIFVSKDVDTSMRQISPEDIVSYHSLIMFGPALCQHCASKVRQGTLVALFCLL